MTFAWTYFKTLLKSSFFLFYFQENLFYILHTVKVSFPNVFNFKSLCAFKNNSYYIPPIVFHQE